MQGKIGLEEHFASPETLQDSAGFVPGAYWRELSMRLLDLHDVRLRQMDANGMEIMILSLNAPAVQAVPDPKKAYELAVRANDLLAEQVAKRPDRFQAFAAQPMQDPGDGIALGKRGLEISQPARCSEAADEWRSGLGGHGSPVARLEHEPND